MLKYLFVFETEQTQIIKANKVEKFKKFPRDVLYGSTGRFDGGRGTPGALSLRYCLIYLCNSYKLL